MFIKTSAGIHTVGDQSNVGIGTTNPASGLDVSLKTDGIALPEELPLRDQADLKSL